MFKVMNGRECYGYAETRAGAEAILRMRKLTRNGREPFGKVLPDTLMSRQNLSIVQGEPERATFPVRLGYTPGVYGPFK